MKEIMDLRLAMNQRFTEMGKELKFLSSKMDILRCDVFNIRESAL